MNQMAFWPIPPREVYCVSHDPAYHRDWYTQNIKRRRAQRLASKWGGSFRDYLRGCV